MVTNKIFRSVVLLGMFVGVKAIPCMADPLVFTATMTGAQEIPPNSSTASGFASVTLNGNLLTVNESFSGLTSVATGAHIHCCAAPGVSAPVVLPFPFPPFPAATAGTFTDTFDLSTFSFTGGATEASFLAGLESGLAYVNIHNANFPAGEIRGQLLQVTATPEPGTLLLLGTGIAGLAGMVRRRVDVVRR